MVNVTGAAIALRGRNQKAVTFCPFLSSNMHAPVEASVPPALPNPHVRVIER
jgi:hypothetical protein